MSYTEHHPGLTYRRQTFRLSANVESFCSQRQIGHLQKPLSLPVRMKAMLRDTASSAA